MVYPVVVTYFVVGLVAAVTQAGYAVYIIGISRKVAPAAWVLMVSALWACAAIAERAAPALSTKLVADRLQYVGLAALPLIWLVFCLKYARQDRPLGARMAVSLAVLPALLLGLILTNDYHDILWASPPTLVGGTLHKDRAWGFWILMAYIYVYIAAGTVILVRLARSKARGGARQVRAMILAVVSPAAAGVLDILVPPALQGLELAPIALGVSVLVVIYGFARLGFGGRLRIAHRTVVETMADPVVIVDVRRRVLYLNQAAETKLGMSLKRDRGHPLAGSGATIADAAETAIASPDGGADLDLSPRRYHVQVSNLSDWGGEPIVFVAVFRDVTALHVAEARLRELAAQEELAKSAREKEVLLRELHHRVRNQMQIMSSLLSLQGARIKDPVAREPLESALGRIRAIALMHEHLDVGRAGTDIGVYLEHVARGTLETYGRPEIGLESELESVELTDRQTTVCGLIVTELVSNALKHAYPGGRAGVIRVRLDHVPGGVCLAVRDDGVGMKTAVDLTAPTTLGYLIVTVLARQLGGDIEIIAERGTEVRLTFRESAANGRLP